MVGAILAAGNATALYIGTADYTSYLETKKALVKGESYSINDIVDAIKTLDENEYDLSGDISYSMIDCGGDGIQELLVNAPFGDFEFLMIIKEIDGELVICYDRDSWPRSYVAVNDDGTIEGSGSGAANMSISDYSYVDANGDFHYYYGIEETITLLSGEYYVFDKEDYAIISTEGLDQEHLGIRDYYFEPNYEDRVHYYSYFVIDDNYNDVTTDADYDDSNELKQRLKNVGATVCTKAEIDQMLSDRAKEISYPLR